MTLILGILCRDGIVMGADGAATYVAGGMHTIRQAVTKLAIVDDQLIVGVSGPIGLGDMIKAAISDMHTAQKKFARGDAIAAMSQVRERIFKVIKPELDAADAARNVNPTARAAALSHTLLGVPVSNQPTLIQFDAQGSPEAASKDLPFVAVGNGQPLADPFLAFLRRVFWPKNPPNLGEGIFAATWCLDHAIKTHPGGVAEPIQIAVIEPITPTPKSKDASHWRARELTKEECQQHLEHVDAAEKELVKWRKTFTAPPTEDAAQMTPPSPPAPPDARKV